MAPLENAVISLHLSGSKSIANRLLTLYGLHGSLEQIKLFANWPEAKDVQVMRSIVLNQSRDEWDVDIAGTCLRFSLILALFQKHDVKITGKGRLLKRPIAPLVGLLNTMGASIRYIGDEGYLPLHVKPQLPHKLSSHLTLPLFSSSQFVSALLLLATKLPNPLTLVVHPNQFSYSYIALTLATLKAYGIRIEENKREITVYPSNISFPKQILIESDWSSASYWMLFALLFPQSRFKLSQFFEESYQGDSQVLQWSNLFGVDAVLENGTLQFKKNSEERLGGERLVDLDCANCPDLVPTLCVAAALSGQPVRLDSVESLQLKESKRLDVLHSQLSKFTGVEVVFGEHWIEVNGQIDLEALPEIEIQTFQDHRIAMAFAPLSVYSERVRIEDPEVVEKSYPLFWSHVAYFREEMQGAQ